MSIKKSIINQKQKDLESLCWNFKQYVLNNKLISDLPAMVNNQIHTLYHNLEQCSFTHDQFTALEGQISSEEYTKKLIVDSSKMSNWEITKEKISKEQIQYFKDNFAVIFKEEDIFVYTFFRDIYTKKDINRIVLVVFPQYYYVKFQIMSDEIGVSELLNEEELKNIMQREFN